MHVQVIIGSVRDGRKGRPVGDWVQARIAARGDATVELLDLKEWDLPLYDQSRHPNAGDYREPRQRAWAERIAAGDAYLLVSPEYNHGYSPALKNALDSIYAEWGRKPASFVAYGGTGGTRAVEQLRQVLVAMQLVPLTKAVHITDAGRKIAEDRFTGDTRDEKQLDGVVDDLLWWGRLLAAERAAAN